MRISRHAFFTEAHVIEKKFDLIAIAVAPDSDFLTFFSRPIPVREKMDDRLIAPPRFVIVIIIFRKPAGIHHTKLRADGGPIEGRWLAAIIKTGPDESAFEKFSGSIKRPA